MDVPGFVGSRTSTRAPPSPPEEPSYRLAGAGLSRGASGHERRREHALVDTAPSVGYMGVLVGPAAGQAEAERVVQLPSLPTKVVLAVGLVLLIGSMGVSAAALRRTAVASCGPSVVSPSVLYTVSNDGGVTPGATAQSQFKVTGSPTVLSLKTYHYVAPNGVAAPGMIGLIGPDGKTYGPWQTTGSVGMHGVANAFWTVTLDLVLPAGQYIVTDSDPATWSANAGTGGTGMFWITGYQK